MKNFLLLLIPVLLGACSPCVKPEGEVETRELMLPAVESFHLKGGSTVRLFQGAEQKITITAPADAIEMLNQNVNGTHWDIAFDPCIRDEDDVEISITLTNLNELSLTGSGSITGNGFFNTGELIVTLTGSGDITGTFNATSLIATLTGSGEMNLSGSSNSLQAEVDGSGELEAREFKCSSATVLLNGSGDAFVNVRDKLDANVNGSGDINYYGSPASVSTNVNGSGEVIKK